MKQANQNSQPNRESEVLYFTSDYLSFFDEQSALEHAFQLADSTITTKTKEDIDAELESINDNGWDVMGTEEDEDKD